MLNPFSSTNTNIFDERTQNTTPGTLFGQDVLVSQEQHRKIFNTLTTSVTGMPGIYPTMQPSFQDPNAVTFTFKANQEYYPQNYWYCQTPAMQSLNQLQQQTAADLLQLQRQLNQPYQCKFHLDCQTSTTDLGAKPEARPDLKNLAGMILCTCTWLQGPISKNHKKLILKEVTPKIEGSICDQINQEEEKAKKVSFESPEGMKNAQVQAECKCPSCTGHKGLETPVRVKQKRRRNRKKSPTTTTDESTDNESDVR
ncbi:uncharacterized protein LOC123012823 [Tribolium madens]|uniref:uncharacterized protein LOC123012823 n=1 Tax=Tribolium madens TaxID=41895 RepID=UPI001CF72ECB|nr:uncharacterized protein LOC123012823 [Tribolium madens]XP_044266928.1 uncharacterized protein LOC123012823 [Tribolium madens]XP_044266937.1 uncharacterized protein LOC123012823 [Tribolium madens]